MKKKCAKDLLSDKLLKLFEKRGGQIGKQLQSIMTHMTEVRMYFGKRKYCFDGVGLQNKLRKKDEWN